MLPQNLNQPDPRLEIVTQYRRIEALLPSHWAQETVLANNIHQHFYRTGGDKPPLVLLHGILDGALTWLRTAQALEGDYDVILVDTRGHGHSERIGGDFAQESLTEDITALMRTLELGTARVIGHSLGGGTAIHLADSHPELVHSFIVEGWGEDGRSAAVMDNPGYKAWLNTYVAWLEQLKTQSHQERMVSALNQTMPDAPLLPEREYVAWVEMCAALDLDLVRLGATLWSTSDKRSTELRQALQRVTCPLLILKSDFFPKPGTPTVRPEASDQANVQIVRFEHTGHLIHQGQFELFIDEVRRFFAAH